MRSSWKLILIMSKYRKFGGWTQIHHESTQDVVSRINYLQQIQNCLARTVVNGPKSSHITPILRSLHWLKINERIEYKLLSLTYKVLKTSQPYYLRNLISVQSTCRTCSLSSQVCLTHVFNAVSVDEELEQYDVVHQLINEVQRSCPMKTFLHEYSKLELVPLCFQQCSWWVIELYFLCDEE